MPNFALFRILAFFHLIWLFSDAVWLFFGERIWQRFRLPRWPRLGRLTSRSQSASESRNHANAWVSVCTTKIRYLTLSCTVICVFQVWQNKFISLCKPLLCFGVLYKRFMLAHANNKRQQLMTGGWFQRYIFWIACRIPCRPNTLYRLIGTANKQIKYSTSRAIKRRRAQNAGIDYRDK